MQTPTIAPPSIVPMNHIDEVYFDEHVTSEWVQSVINTLEFDKSTETEQVAAMANDNWSEFVSFNDMLCTLVLKRLAAYLKGKIPLHKKDLALCKCWVWNSFKASCPR